MCFLCRICLLSLLRRPISNSLIWWRLKKMWEFGFGKYTLKLFKTGEQLNHKYRLHRPPIQYSPIWTTLDSIFRKLQVRWNAMLVLHSSHFKYPKLLYLQLHRTYFGVCVCVNEQRERGEHWLPFQLTAIMTHIKSRLAYINLFSVHYGRRLITLWIYFFQLSHKFCS